MSTVGARLALLLALGATTPACCLFGAFAGDRVVEAPVVDAGELGGTKGFALPLRVPVGPSGRGPMAGIGRLAWEALFEPAGDPPFVVNVVFACSREGYADAQSPWFDVFTGYYEIDVSALDHDRPFGYRPGPRGLEPDAEAFVRLGKADWSYFSAHLYGVPREVVRPFDGARPAVARSADERVQIGRRYWDALEVRGLTVASAYVAKGDQRLQITHPWLTRAWRWAFGQPAPGLDPPRSFVGTPIRAVLYTAWEESVHPHKGLMGYKTYVFGATINEGYPLGARDEAERLLRERQNDDLLALQVAALRRVMTIQAADLGFEDPK